MQEKSITEFIPGTTIQLLSEDDSISTAFDACVLATGNTVPADPSIKNPSFFESPNYFRNPWDEHSILNADPRLPVLIIGNGLTMADTVIGLKEQHFPNQIFSLSPNGFNIIPHLHNGLKYTKLTEELKPGMKLKDLVSLVNKHVKIAASLGISPEPVIDSLRPFTQQIWQSLSSPEKVRFMNLLRHMWGVARHRIPVPVNEKLNRMKEENKLHIISGKIIDIIEKTPGIIDVTYYDKKLKQEKTVQVGRVINCTGPQTNLAAIKGKHLLKSAFEKGLVSQDELKLGINTNVKTFRVLNEKGTEYTNIYTLGPNLKGMLWESIAVPELRVQARDLAASLLASL